MEWPKLKNIILIILVLTNLCLVAFVAQRELRSSQMQRQARQEAIQADRQRRVEEAKQLQEQRRQEAAQKKTLKEKRKAAQEAKALKAKKAATSTTEAGRVGDRPYARGRSYREDRYDER